MSGVGHTVNTTLATGDQNIDGILASTEWGDAAITYSFPTVSGEYTATNAPYNGADTAPTGFFAMTAAMQNVVRSILDTSYGTAADDGFTVEGFTNLDISETAVTDANLRFAQTTQDPYGFGTAWGYFPSNGESGGDVWFTTAGGYTYANAVTGNYEALTIIHETGHALGLDHAHTVTDYGQVPANMDAMEYTVMTYKSYVNGPLTGYSNETFGYAQTFMMLDIAALQHKYGADFTTNSGDTTYSWDPTSGNTLVNGVAGLTPGANRIFATIWDGGGTDTYDLSAYTTGVTIDLAPGGYSYFSATQIANLGSGNFASGNIYNAMQYMGDARSLIENAIGGSGNDLISGNAANNDLEGGVGSDTLDGGAGNDTLGGSGGTDTFLISAGSDSISGGAAADGFDATGTSGSLDNEVITITVDQTGNGTIVKTNDGGTDTFTSIESFTADETAGTDVITVTGGLTTGQVVGVNATAVGTFTPTVGAPVAFGGVGQPTIADILGGSNGGPSGSYQITAGEEDGATLGGITVANFETVNFSVVCFAPGTAIATPDGERTVESLRIGDTIITTSGARAPVKWIGRQTVTPALAPDRLQPVRIHAGALGHGLPRRDLVVSADHGMILDGMVINASALINQTSIDWVPLSEFPPRLTYYHIETDAHDTILAEGAATETFVDAISRSHFDNHAEYLDLYGTDRIIPEMPSLRITTSRLLPDRIKSRIGISATIPALPVPRSA